jgi:hypothetical protein
MGQASSSGRKRVRCEEPAERFKTLVLEGDEVPEYAPR